MNIEFHIPAGETQEWLVEHIEKKLTELHHEYEHISRAEVYFRKNPQAFDGEYVCEIDLTIFGSSIAVKQSAESFVRASSEVITELEKRVGEQIRKDGDTPDIISSVDV